LTVTLKPPLCGKELSTGDEITGGVIEVLLRATVSIGAGVGVGTGVGRGVATGVGCVRGGLLEATDVLGCVRGGLMTTGFLTVIEEATLCPEMSSG
jgi:hypothetical protein